MSVYQGDGDPVPGVPPPPPEQTAGGWVGVRKPTPEELRAYAASSGWSEDFARYDDPTLNRWISERWDVGRNKFRSYHAPQDAGDWAYVEKPSESVTDPSTGTEWGPWGNQDGVNVTEQKARTAAAQGGAPAPAATTAQAASTPNNNLQQQLIDMFTKGGGYFAEHPGALKLSTGGIIWKDPNENPKDAPVGGPVWDTSGPVGKWVYPSAPGMEKLPGTPTPIGAAGPAVAGDPRSAFGTSPTTPGVNPSLAKATLNAFAPTGAGGVSAGVQPAATPPRLPQTTPPAIPPAAPQLQDQLSRMFANPAQWWRPQNPRMTR